MQVGSDRLWARAALAVVAVALAFGPAVSAEAPEKPITRDLLRHVMIDKCVYAETARPDAEPKKIVPSCQCAALQFVKTVKDEDIAKLTPNDDISPDWMTALNAALPACQKRSAQQD